jgi:hypothetical protein
MDEGEEANLDHHGPWDHMDSIIMIGMGSVSLLVIQVAC